MRQNRQTRQKRQKRRGGYSSNNSWILNPLPESSTQHTTISLLPPNTAVRSYHNSSKSELQHAQRINPSGNSGIIQSYGSSSTTSVGQPKQSESVNTFKTVPLQYNGIAPLIMGLESTKYVYKTPSSQNGNYSYIKNQFGPYSQNKVKNSLKKRVKTFFTGPPRTPYTRRSFYNASRGRYEEPYTQESPI